MVSQWDENWSKHFSFIDKRRYCYSQADQSSRSSLPAVLPSSMKNLGTTSLHIRCLYLTTRTTTTTKLWTTTTNGNGLPGLRSLYSDGPEIKPFWGRVFPCPSRPAPWLNALLVQWIPGLPEDKAVRTWCWLPTPIYRRCSEWVEARPPFPSLPARACLSNLANALSFAYIFKSCSHFEI